MAEFIYTQIDDAGMRIDENYISVFADEDFDNVESIEMAICHANRGSWLYEAYEEDGSIFLWDGIGQCPPAHNPYTKQEDGTFIYKKGPTTLTLAFEKAGLVATLSCEGPQENENNVRRFAINRAPTPH